MTAYTATVVAGQPTTFYPDNGTIMDLQNDSPALGTALLNENKIVFTSNAKLKSGSCTLTWNDNDSGNTMAISWSPGSDRYITPAC